MRGTVSIGRAEAERFARIELPSELSNLRARKLVGGMDDVVGLRFTVPRKQLPGLRSIITQPLKEGDMAIFDEPWLGWRVEDSKRFLGAGDIVKGVGRNVLVVLDEADRPVVYILASTI